MFDLTYLSFGVGLQSTALLAMSAMGLRNVPRVDLAIFADPWFARREEMTSNRMGVALAKILEYAKCQREFADTVPDRGRWGEVVALAYEGLGRPSMADIAEILGQRTAERCPNCGGTDHVDPLPGTVGRRCIKCCHVCRRHPFAPTRQFGKLYRCSECGEPTNEDR